MAAAHMQAARSWRMSQGTVATCSKRAPSQTPTCKSSSPARQTARCAPPRRDFKSQQKGRALEGFALAESAQCVRVHDTKWGSSLALQHCICLSDTCILTGIFCSCCKNFVSHGRSQHRASVRKAEQTRTSVRLNVGGDASAPCKVILLPQPRQFIPCAHYSQLV